jgi:hypothetical protein
LIVVGKDTVRELQQTDGVLPFACARKGILVWALR